MVRMVFLISVALAALGSPVLAGGLECDDCELYKRGVHRQVVPTPDTVCVPFVQPRRGSVLLRLNLKNGQSRPYTKKNAGTVDCISVGRYWLQELTESMYICDDFNHADYPYADVQAVARQPKRSRDNEACLFGREPCRSMGYKTY